MSCSLGGPCPPDVADAMIPVSHPGHPVIRSATDHWFPDFQRRWATRRGRSGGDRDRSPPGAAVDVLRGPRCWWGPLPTGRV